MRSKSYFLKGQKKLPPTTREEVVMAISDLCDQMPMAKISKKLGFAHTYSLYRIFQTERMSARSAEAILKLRERVFDL